MAKSVIDWIAYVLVIIGALNWGLVAISPKAELVQYLSASWLIGLVYALVGIAGLWTIYSVSKE